MTKIERFVLENYGESELNVYRKFTRKKKNLYAINNKRRSYINQKPYSPTEYKNAKKGPQKKVILESKQIKSMKRDKKQDSILFKQEKIEIKHNLNIKELPNEAEYEAKFNALWLRPEFLAQIKGA